MYVSGRGNRSNQLGIVQAIIDVATLIDAVSGGLKERAIKKGKRIGMMEDNLLLSSRRYADGRHEGLLPPPPFGALGAMTNYLSYPGVGGATPKTPMNISRWPPAGKKTGLTEIETRAVRQYQQLLLPWFQTVLEQARHRSTIDQAEAYLREWLIDPIDYYKALAQQLGITPGEIAPTFTAQAATAQTTAAPTIVQAAQQAVATQAAQIPSSVYVAPAPPGGESYAPAPAAPVAPSTAAPVAGPVKAGIDWGKWAVPIAMIAAALISANSRRAPTLADDEEEAVE